MMNGGSFEQAMMLRMIHTSLIVVDSVRLSI